MQYKIPIRIPSSKNVKFSKSTNQEAICNKYNRSFEPECGELNCNHCIFDIANKFYFDHWIKNQFKG